MIDRATGYPVFRAKLGIGRYGGIIATANLAHLFRRQDSVTAILRRSPFSKFVLSVVRVSSEKQMFRSYARRIVALVQDKQSIGNGCPIMDFPGYAVRKKLRCARAEYPAIAFTPLGSPEPARANLWYVRGDRPSLINLIPETNSEWYSLLGHGATSDSGCKVSRLVQAFTRLFEPLYFTTISK